MTPKVSKLFFAFFSFCVFILLSGLQPLLESPKVITPPHVAGHAETQRTPFSIATWNIQWFPSSNNVSPEKTTQRIQKVSEFLREQNPTILFACEIRDLASLQKLNLPYPFVACTDFTPESANDPNLGLALMSKIPWKEIWALDFSSLSSSPNKPPRGILGAEFILPSGQKLTLYGVHLKSNKDGDASTDRSQRQQAMKYLEWDWKRRKLDPAKDNIVILGDFNTSMNDPALKKETTLKKLLQQGFVSSVEGLPANERITIVPVRKKKLKGAEFDHIFFSSSLRQQFKNPPPWGKIIPVPRDLSDHYFLTLPALDW
ncbi:MAG: endonuclease/exonuclease/phosphatase family protein [Verrucomicrobiota bacterium]